MRLVVRAEDKNKNKNIKQKIGVSLILARTQTSYSQIVDHCGIYGLAFIVNQKWKNKVYRSSGKSMTEFKFYNQLDPGKPRWF